MTQRIAHTGKPHHAGKTPRPLPGNHAERNAFAHRGPSREKGPGRSFQRTPPSERLESLSRVIKHDIELNIAQSPHPEILRAQLFDRKLLADSASAVIAERIMKHGGIDTESGRPFVPEKFLASKIPRRPKLKAKE